jgi:hypothetical protein
MTVAHGFSLANPACMTGRWNDERRLSQAFDVPAIAFSGILFMMLSEKTMLFTSFFRA